MLKNIRPTVFANLPNLREVKIDMYNIENLVTYIKKQKYEFRKRKINYLNVSQYVQHCFVANAVNFCFWFDKPYRKYKYKNQEGSNAFFEVFDDNSRLKDAIYLSEIEEKDIRALFGNIPLTKERVECLREVGEKLISKYQGQAINILYDSDFNCNKIAEKIVSSFPRWNDSYGGVFFLKRIQKFIYDLWACEELEKVLINKDKCTILADYQIPKILNYYGVLKYSDKLRNDISQYKCLKSGSIEEKSIRVGTIIAGEYIMKELKKHGSKLEICDLDCILWNMGRNLKEIPHHLCASIWY